MFFRFVIFDPTYRSLRRFEADKKLLSMKNKKSFDALLHTTRLRVVRMFIKLHNLHAVKVINLEVRPSYTSSYRLDHARIHTLELFSTLKSLRSKVAASNEKKNGIL